MTDPNPTPAAQVAETLTDEQIDALTPEQLRIEVAERVMGYTVEMRYCESDIECGGLREIESIYTDKSGPFRKEELEGLEKYPCYLKDGIWEVVPDYPHDIAAAWEVEAEIERKGLIIFYINALSNAVLKDENTSVHNDWLHFWLIAHASPEQRCRSALKAVGGRG